MKVAAQLDMKWPQQVFTHQDDDGTVRTFLVETMLQFAKDYPTCTDLIYGNHRIVRAYEDGKKELNCILFKSPFWENFLLPDDVSRKLVESGALHNHSNIH